jgi:hypothetical protein
MWYLLSALFIYLLFRFITGFLWPVFKATSAVKKQFDHMRNQMEKDTPFTNSASESSAVDDKPKFDLGGEYIQFEELKEK